jgi:hypothetical protein
MRNAIIAVMTLATFKLLSGEASAKFTQLQKHDAASRDFGAGWSKTRVSRRERGPILW